MQELDQYAITDVALKHMSATKDQRLQNSRLALRQAKNDEGELQRFSSFPPVNGLIRAEYSEDIFQ
jgi:hypothetical protein